MMKSRKTLTSMVLFGTSMITGACSINPEYVFNGKIGEEQVKFYKEEFRDKTILGDTNILEVVKTDGNKTRYVDFLGDDLKLEYIEMTVGENTIRTYLYSGSAQNPIDADVLEKNQKEFDTYLVKIRDIQTAPLNKK